jgi:hypothetical protein
MNVKIVQIDKPLVRSCTAPSSVPPDPIALAAAGIRLLKERKNYFGCVHKKARNTVFNAFEIQGFF